MKRPRVIDYCETIHRADNWKYIKALDEYIDYLEKQQPPLDVEGIMPTADAERQAAIAYDGEDRAHQISFKDGIRWAKSYIGARLRRETSKLQGGGKWKQ